MAKKSIPEQVTSRCRRRMSGRQYRKTREFRIQQDSLFQSSQDSARLSHMRYKGGVTGYLEVLTNETNAFSAELALVQARLNELLALVQLYEALGGGWQQ